MLKKNRVIRIPVFWKFAIASTIIVVLFGSINIYLLWSSVYKSFEKEIDKRCKVLATIISDKSLKPMVYEDFVSLYDILNNIKTSDPSISYIFILNNKNELVAQTYESEIPKGLVDVNSLDSGQYNIKVIETVNYDFPIIRDIAFPILNGDVGTVRLGIVEDHIQKEIDEATKTLIIMIVFFFLLGLAGAFFFSYIITRPIKAISQRAQTIDFNYIDTEPEYIHEPNKTGIFNTQIIDESDTLVTKFYEMIERLRKSRIEQKETQSALVQAEKMASLGTLSAGVAHEINNPISGINNCLNRIVKQPEKTERNLEYVLMIKEAILKIENVVKHLLKFSRKQDIVFNKINLSELINSTLKLTEYKLESNKIGFQNKLNEDCYINGSSNHLEQVFVNLILNSIDSIVEKKEKIPDWKGQISIEIRANKGKVFVIFKDNGIGVAKGNAAQIFDPFYTSKQVGKGTGLGLSVSFNIINKHKGSISLNPYVLEGAEFLIEMPCYSGSQNA